MYLDLEYEARTNGQFRHRLRALVDELEHWHNLSQRDPAHHPRYREALLALFRFCSFNSVFLIPYFWPHYCRDHPLNFSAFPFSWPMFQLQFGGFMVFRGSRQIGKSTAFCCRQQLNARLIRGFKSLFVVPRSQQLETYANKMREIEQAMKGFSGRRSADLRKNLAYKEFSNGSTIEMVHALASASRVRGKSADEILYDENQDFDPDLEIEVAQIQSASPMPITIYAGTSLTTDTMLEKKWSQSSQGLWVTRCDACRHENIPLPEQGVLDMIQPTGPACVKCGARLNVRQGRFIHSYPNLVSAGRLGFHVPQIILPAVVNNPVRWAKIHELKLKSGGDRKFAQEVLGIAVEQGEREITKKNLMDMCVLGRDLPALLRKAQQRGYEFVVSGCDWGGSDYVPAQHIKISTTVHVIIGVLGTGLLDILFIRRYSGMNYDDIVGDIMRNHAAYNGRAIASDFGVGAVYNSKIREKFPAEKHLIFNYVGPTSDLISEPKRSHIYNQWSLNKTESISLTFDAVRKQRIRCFDWSIAEEYLSDFLNLFRAPGESSSGAGAGGSTFIYRSHPTKPNDTLMAVNYGFMLAKILRDEAMFADINLKLQLEQALRTDPHNLSGIFPGAFSA